MRRPHSHGLEGRPGPRAMSEGWDHGTDYFLGPGIPVLNWQVAVELHVYVSRAILIKCEPCNWFSMQMVLKSWKL